MVQLNTPQYVVLVIFSKLVTTSQFILHCFLTSMLKSLYRSLIGWHKHRS